MSREEGPEPLRPETSPGFLLWRATLRWQRLMTSTLKPLGLTHVQFVLLASAWWLQEHEPEAPRQRTISEHAETDPMMTSQVLRALEAKGLLSRSNHPRDGRAMTVSVSEEGAVLAREAVRLVEDADRRFFGSLPDQGVALRMLRTLAAEGRPGR